MYTINDRYLDSHIAKMCRKLNLKHLYTIFVHKFKASGLNLYLSKARAKKTQVVSRSYDH